MEIPSSLFSLVGKVALVTGGARGIGASTVRMLAAAGAWVAVTDLLEDEGAALALELDSDKKAARFWRLDVAVESEVSRVMGEIESHFGRLDILINNAGVGGAKVPVDQLELQLWQQVMAINAGGTFLCTKHAIPALKRAGGGSVVNVSSMFGLVGGSGSPAYHASKGAVRMMAKNDALQYAGDNIRVNSVHPGFIRTPLIGQGLSRAEDVEALFAVLAQRTPLQKVGAPEDVAAGILYLVSDAGRFVTGTELVIDGGYTAA